MQIATGQPSRENQTGKSPPNSGRFSVSQGRCTNDIGPIKITQETSIGANLRRIFATTGTGTLDRFRDEEQRLNQAASLLGVPPEEIVGGVERLRTELAGLRDELKSLRRQAAGAGAVDIAAQGPAGQAG